MAFVATCIEAVARRLGVSYRSVFERMERVGLIEGFILPGYEVLHSESRDVLTDRVIECLENWESEL